MKYSSEVFYFFLIVALFSSCLTHAQNKKSSSTNELEGTNAELIVEINALEQDTIRTNLVIDSLLNEITRLQSFVSVDAVEKNDSLKNSIDSLSQRVIILEENNEQLKNQLTLIKRQYSEIFRLSGTEALKIKTQQSEYDCYKVNLKETNLALFWQDENGQPLRSLNALQDYLKRRGHQLVFAMNAGMYKPDNSPQGLYIEKGKELIQIDKRKEEYGNFYMQPNGVFMMDSTHTASIVITDEFDSSKSKKAVFATQSGPMALINGEINKKFNIESTSKHIRNGVGIIDNHTIVFIISNKRVNLYDFALVFKEHFNCSNALYLDGAISKMYLPEMQRLQKGGNFGPLIGIYKK